VVAQEKGWSLLTGGH